MKNMIQRLIQTYGTKAMITTGSTTFEERLFFQLVTSKSWQNMERMVSSGGEIPRGQFLFIAPPDREISNGDVLRVNGRYFLVRRADAVLLGDESLFLWGLCVEGGGESLWTS